MSPDLKLGALFVVGGVASSLPLDHTAVSGRILGPIAAVRVEQRFGNPFKQPIELEYLFPLPEEAAIVDYQIQIGQRTVRAHMLELVSARQTYAEATNAGQRASLLEQRRPNLFAVRVGNVQPGEVVVASLDYEERLHFSDDAYQFVFPMGITPKYHADPGQARQLDAPIAQPSERIAPVQINLEVDGGVPLGEPSSPSHAVTINRVDAQHIQVTLATPPNKDLVLRLPVAHPDIQTAMWISQGKTVNTALITILPPRWAGRHEPMAREFVFVLDRSGSMSNAPIRQARQALRACLRTLREQDTFAIAIFDDRLEWLSPIPQAVSQASVERADTWLDSIEGRGGTEIVPALQAALSLPVDPTRQRYLVVLTDGAVSAEDQAYRLVKQRGRGMRLFTFGIGPSVNRALVSRLAQLGRGRAEYLQLDEDIEAAIIRFADRVSYPALQNLKLTWQGVQAWDTYPVDLPDLYVGQPLEVVTRLQGQGMGQLSGDLGGQPVSFPFVVGPAANGDAAIDRL